MSAVVVVESPAKAKTIEKYLGKGYKVLASYGHVRAFPKKDGSVDPDNDFAIKYQVIADKKKRLDAINTAMKKADTLILASDLDREGEAIAWHVAEVLRERGSLKGKTVQRITFNEITKKAITEAIANPSEVDMQLVDAQQARSALDYLVGFTLSPLLWRKVRSGLSAGRVQSVALRLICEREQHIREFKPKEFWTINSECEVADGLFQAQLHAVEDKPLGKFAITDGVNAKVMARRVAKGDFLVSEVQKKQSKQQPAAPFITTTLQMDASRKLGFTARKTMQVAQKLYEGIEVEGEPVGLISYMRTDSVSLSEDAIVEMRDYIGNNYGDSFLPAQPRRFKTKSKNAQEAHEAIRPTSIHRTPDSLKRVLDSDGLKLYKLIWKRALASQMAPAILDQVRADIESGTGADKLTLRATGSTLAFPGFRKLYIEGTDEPGKQEQEKLLPPLAAGDAVTIKEAEAKQHFTEPKPRFSEATLVKELEADGIGRPSTYASILNVLRERKYVDMEKKRFVPTDTGEHVNDYLLGKLENTISFDDIIDVKFTANIEDRLDGVARGEQEWKPVLRDFWTPFKAKVDSAMGRPRPAGEMTDEKCPECGKPMAIKLGKYGKFLACTGYPECKQAKPLNGNGNGEAAEEPELSDQKCEKCGEPMVIKSGRYGKFLGCSAYPACKNIQPMEKPVDTGIKCTACGKGTFLEKKSRRGKVFYSCSGYPKCKSALWDKPIDRQCPECQAPFVTEKKTKRRGTEHVCVTEGCGWKEQVELPESA
ncbi:DNA topoisomerase I [Mariprofundus ferrinatatus]|uniref:DNA topoisomerase 1 n=1 Tax=Mariprofundus ferrinatatus TaxID=1921087 RepID=A0A2K8L7H3_9PROT|nr:type I DNA topoisomerase [Mariprofundus ferrinatatus]ATX83082.1 DNA topoisomerase I [Mariprofundus ferrinatatus]